MNRFSILQEKKECYVCHIRIGLHIHEVYFGRNRQKSIEDGCCIYLCSTHHNMSDKGIHFDHDFDLKVKKAMEKRWLEHYNKTTEDFIKRYGKNYL